MIITGMGMRVTAHRVSNEESAQPHASLSVHPPPPRPPIKKMVRFLEVCVSSLRRGHANLLCIVPNFVNVFGFPLGRVLGESADMYTSDVIAQAVRGPIISEV